MIVFYDIMQNKSISLSIRVFVCLSLSLTHALFFYLCFSCSLVQSFLGVSAALLSSGYSEFYMLIRSRR